MGSECSHHCPIPAPHKEWLLNIKHGKINHTSFIGASICDPLLSVIFVTTKFINVQ